MKTYKAIIEVEVSAKNEDQAQEKVEQYLSELIDDGSLDVTFKEDSL